MNTPAVRTPERFRQRVIQHFTSTDNIRSLHKSILSLPITPSEKKNIVMGLIKTVEAFGHGPGRELLSSDPGAQRTDTPLGLGAALSRLNTTFIQNRLDLIKEHRHAGHNRDWLYETFAEESLYPTGLEHLNGEAPLHGFQEDVTTYESSRPPGVSTEDWAWDAGKATRTAEQAQAEYWGEGAVESHHSESTGTGIQDPVIHGDLWVWGGDWKKNNGSRFMRRPDIPFWQRGGGRNHETNIDDTLGTMSRELDAPVRGWDVGRIWKW